MPPVPLPVFACLPLTIAVGLRVARRVTAPADFAIARRHLPLAGVPASATGPSGPRALRSHHDRRVPAH